MKEKFKQVYRASKYYLPPVIFDKINYFRNYLGFLKYKDLVAKNIELKDKHKGERCFILGSGPSIKKEDLKPLKNEIVFALNNFYVHEDFDIIMSGEKPKYYMTAPIHPPQPENEWKDWFSDMEKYVPKTTTMLLGLNGYDGNIKYIFDKYRLFENHTIYWYYAGVKVNEYYKFNKKDIDITNMIWSANTVSIYALIFAIFMGFKEIYLVGMDHNNICFKEKIVRFYNKGIHQKNEEKIIKNLEYSSIKFLNTFFLWKQYIFLKTFNKNIKVVNTSSDSLLDIFEFEKLEKVTQEGFIL